MLFLIFPIWLLVLCFSIEKGQKHANINKFEFHNFAGINKRSIRLEIKTSFPALN